MRRVGGSTYQVETFLTPLKTVAREAKHMDAGFIVNGNDISASFVEYAKPLVGRLPVVGTLDELRR